MKLMQDTTHVNMLLLCLIWHCYMSDLQDLQDCDVDIPSVERNTSQRPWKITPLQVNYWLKPRVPNSTC